MTGTAHQQDRPYSVEPQQIQDLPFRVRLAQSEADLQRAVQIRRQAYGRHVPGMEEVLREAEPDDHRADAVLILAEAKDSGDVLGSLRLLTNLSHPLHLEEEVALPARFQGQRLLEAWRLTVRNSQQARMVSAALYKTLYEVSYHCEIDHVFVVARHPVDRLYKAMQFRDALDGHKIALSNTLGIPHGLYYLPVKEADSLWRQARCPLYPFMALTHHPDIDIDHRVVRARFTQAPRSHEAISHGLPI
jgi:hypothetical protein